MSELLECFFAIGILIIGALIVWSLFHSSSEMRNWTDEDWIENYEGDPDDPIWY